MSAFGSASAGNGPLGSDQAGEAPVSFKTWIAVSGAVLGAFLPALNIQITNTALPYIEGGIGTDGVYGTWIYRVVRTSCTIH